jgi:hypothetical protein
MLPILFYDPTPSAHEYLTQMYFAPMRQYLMRALNKPAHTTDSLERTHNATVLCLADYLNPESVAILKNNGNKIVGFSVTDSSWISQSCRAGDVLKHVDLMFMLTGIQKVNEGRELVMTPDFEFKMEPRTFLSPEDWGVFHGMHISGRLQSLGYVHWERQPDVPAQPYASRSQKVLMRGGHHMRRFLLALEFMRGGRLDCNSGFVTTPYFQDDMNPQFRYCDECRAFKKSTGKPFSIPQIRMGCTNPCRCGFLDVSDLGAWNNKCPQSFAELAYSMGFMGDYVESLLNARWLRQQEHLEMLARITFTSDYKWLFSIYAAQRFWDAALVGAINLLPSRTADQDYFPVMHPDEHYVTFDEDLGKGDVWKSAEISEAKYNAVSKAARALYDEWMRPTDYTISTNLLRHIFTTIETYTA